MGSMGKTGRLVRDKGSQPVPSVFWRLVEVALQT